MRTPTHSPCRPVLRLALLAIVASTACRGAGAPVEAHEAVPDGEVRLAAGSPKRAAIVVDTVRELHERVIATLPAQLVPDEDHTVRVLSPVVGRIVRLLVQAGDHVRAGQPLAELRSADAGQATSDVAKATNAWSLARTALARAADLYEHKVIAAKDLEQARNDEAQARADVERARARASQLGMAGAGVSDAFILRAPVAGVVIDRTANPGAEVRPDNGQPLFTISSLDAVWLAISVPQRDLPLVHRGARVRFRSEASPDRTVDAQVTFVSDALDPTSRTATARAVIANPGGMLHVHTAGDAEMLVSESTPVVAVPARALVTHGNDAVVFVEASPGRFIRRVVTVRDDDGVMAMIAAGLAAGERVVTTGSLLLAAEAQHAP
jgi:cobalt-zinc-cadmium efflux system membrane fusion protein